jgi:hypothetical protein
MLEYGKQGAMGGAYGNDFAAQPKVVQGGKLKYKDPYGGVGTNEYVLLIQRQLTYLVYSIVNICPRT